MLNWFKRKPEAKKNEVVNGQYTVAMAIIDMCKMLDDRALIHVIHKAVEDRRMAQEDFMILRLRIDMLYDRRFDKSVQDHIDPV